MIADPRVEGGASTKGYLITFGIHLFILDFQVTQDGAGNVLQVEML
jgi:hypothetical protein